MGSVDGVTTASIRPTDKDDWPTIWSFFQTIVAEGETYAYPLDLTSALPIGFAHNSPFRSKSSVSNSVPTSSPSTTASPRQQWPAP